MFAHDATHIPQPPHTAGKPFQGLRARIDPNQIPSPVDVAELDEDVWRGRQFMTLPGEHVPLATTKVTSIDQGCSSPDFIRATTWHLPHSYELARECHIPLASIIRPFAKQPTGEEPVPTVDFGENGPPRCAQCRAYINPWCTWVAGGAKWKCNLCGHETEVSSAYFSNLDATQLRMDHLQRPELIKGTIDFIVSSSHEYYAPPAAPRLVPSYYTPEPPEPPTTRHTPESMRVLFAIDVSQEAILSGFTAAACEAVSGALYGIEAADGRRMDPCFPERCRVGFITYDESVHFYDLSPDRDSAAMLLVPDIESEMFAPLQDGTAFVDPHISRNTIQPLLSEIPSRFSDQSTRLSALGASLRGALALLARRGGQVLFFLSSACTIGPGTAENRRGLDENKLYDTDQEKQLFRPSNSMWNDLAEEMADEGIGVSAIVATASTSFVDFASFGPFVSTTGGDLRLFPHFTPPRDSLALRSHLAHLLIRETAYSCRARVRVSTGLRVKALHGALAQGGASADFAEGEAAMGILHADNAFAAVYAHTGRATLDVRGSTYGQGGLAHVQCAVLYTTRDGERRVRVLNLALRVTELAGNVFRYADSDATVAFFAKESMTLMGSHTLAHIRESLTERCSSILLAYRRNCAAATSPSQLILPEAFKLLPLYVLGLHKNRSLRAHNVPADVRNYYSQRLLSMPVRMVLYHLYPRFMALHDLTDTIALPTEQATAVDGVALERNEMQLPGLMRDSFTGMRANGVYLIENEERSILWIGQNVSPQIVQDIFNVDSIQDIDTHRASLPSTSSILSIQVRNILSVHEAERGGVTLPFAVARQNMDGAELEFSDMLVEDQNCGAMSYIDYLCFVHKQINVALTNNTSIESAMSYGLRGSGTPW